ncbi:MAG: hypothetical protein OXL96_28255 [Candidatus Poribacteria bacterium]|nr:hypothetical protein [Candidatus Poribacteria bacterium]
MEITRISANCLIIVPKRDNYAIKTRDFVTGSTDVDKSDMTLVSVTAEAAIIRVELPTDVSGGFTVGVTGDVTVDGTVEMLSGAAKLINYDTLSSLGATFGTPEYRDDGIIAIPVTFAYNVIAPSATIFPIARVSGDHIYEMETWIVGEDRAYELLCQMPMDGDGRFSVGVNGSVFKEFSGNYDTVSESSVLTNFLINSAIVEPLAFSTSFATTFPPLATAPNTILFAVPRPRFGFPVSLS